MFLEFIGSHFLALTQKVYCAYAERECKYKIAHRGLPAKQKWILDFHQFQQALEYERQIVESGRLPADQTGPLLTDAVLQGFRTRKDPVDAFKGIFSVAISKATYLQGIFVHVRCMLTKNYCRPDLREAHNHRGSGYNETASYRRRGRAGGARRFSSIR